MGPSKADPLTGDPPQADGRLYLVWSHRHAAWRAAFGYNRRPEDARVFSHAAALQACCFEALLHGPDHLGALPDLPVLRDDVMTLHGRAWHDDTSG
jgi:hypothetical protein